MVGDAVPRGGRIELFPRNHRHHQSVSRRRGERPGNAEDEHRCIKRPQLVRIDVSGQQQQQYDDPGQRHHGAGQDDEGAPVVTIHDRPGQHADRYSGNEGHEADQAKCKRAACKVVDDPGDRDVEDMLADAPEEAGCDAEVEVTDEKDRSISAFRPRGHATEIPGTRPGERRGRDAGQTPAALDSGAAAQPSASLGKEVFVFIPNLRSRSRGRASGTGRPVSFRDFLAGRRPRINSLDAAQSRCIGWL